MMNKIVHMLIVVFLAVSCNHSPSQQLDEQITKWVLANSQQIESLEFSEKQSDLSSLEQIVGDADLVCLGESRHDIHEQFLLKNRFIKYLVQEMGFTCFVLEASLPYSNKVNDYILHGTGNIDEILSGMPGWFLWDTAEIKELLQWIFEYNQNPNNIKKVTFFGIDIVAPNDALEQIFEYLQKVDEPYFTEVQNRNFARSIIEDHFWPATRQNYTELTVNEKQALSESYTELFEHIIHNKDSYVASSSVQKYEWIKQLSYSAKEANRMFSENDQLAMGLIRDRAMANIALWIKERNEKTIIWAHNVHIAKSEFTMSILPGSKIKGMGYFLNQELIDRMVSIAASFNQGSFRNENKNFEPAGIHTIDGALATLDMEYFILDLNGKSKHDNVEQWLNTDQIIRGQDFEMICVPAEAFDAIYYTADISRVNYNPTTLERKRN